MAKHENRHHEINYIEFAVRDLSEAKRFYGDAFGWKFTDYGDAYVGIQHPYTDGECGGMHQAEEVSDGGPLVILYSEALEQSLASVQQAGGDVTAEIFSFPGGRRFHFADPSGNQLAVWSDK